MVAGLAYVIGATTVHKRWFPYAQLKDWKDSVMGPSVEKPRASLFGYFSPDVEVVMVGDSLTQGVIWAEAFNGIAIANRGVGGDTATDIVARMDSILSTRPEVAFIMVGLNDVNLGLSTDEVLDDYTKIVDALQRAGVEVIVQSTIECSADLCGSTLEGIRELNGKLVVLADNRKLVYVDLNRALADEGGLKPAYTYDGIHLTGEGYQAWVDVLSNTMREKVAKLRFADRSRCRQDCMARPRLVRSRTEDTGHAVR